MRSWPNFEEKVLPNGMRVLFVHDPGLPYISYTLMNLSGSDADPTDLPGLGHLVAQTLDKGTATRSAIQVAEDLGLLGADFNAQVDRDHSLFSVTSLAQNHEKLLDLLAEIIMSPSFSEKEISRIRGEILSQIQKQVDEPDEFAENLWGQFIYGSQHPYGHPIQGQLSAYDKMGAGANIKKLKRRMIQHYLRFYRPNTSILAVVGQFQSDVIMAKIENKFGKWEKREAQALIVEKPAAPNGQVYRLVDKPGMVQAQIRLGQPLIERNHPDYLTLKVASAILGGSFTSRLMDRVRKQLGLTYGINSYVDSERAAGVFEITTFTRNDSLSRAIEEIKSIYAKFIQDGVSEEEVQTTKGYLNGLYAAQFEKVERFAIEFMKLRLYGLQDDDLLNIYERLNSISTRSVNKTIRKYFDAKNLKILVYGDAQVLEGQVKALSGGGSPAVNNAGGVPTTTTETFEKKSAQDYL